MFGSTVASVIARFNTDTVTTRPWNMLKQHLEIKNPGKSTARIHDVFTPQVAFS